MAKRNNIINMNVDKNYFDKFFEPERRKLQNRLGKNLSHRGFTEFLVNSGAKLKYPKMNNKFAPKRRKNGNLDFRLI